MVNKDAPAKKHETAIVGGGCFWCTETIFSHTKGVNSVIPGYAGGTKIDPTYEEVSSGKTGHAEVVKVEYEPKAITYGELINIFFSVHDPTTPNRQGPDAGTQYRSIILYTNEGQREIAQKIMDELAEQKLYADPIVTELKPLDKFYPAESYHHRYFEKNSDQAYCQAVVAPKLAKFRKEHRDYYT